MTTPKLTIGRPTDYTQGLGDKICAEIALGRSMRKICKGDSMPCMATIFNWLRTKPEFLEQYERAKDNQADAMAEDIIDIADDGTNDWMERLTEEEQSLGWRLNGEHVQRSRLRVDARKWIASKLKPKKYGDRIATELTGKDGKDLIPETDSSEIARKIAFLLSQAKT